MLARVVLLLMPVAVVVAAAACDEESGSSTDAGTDAPEPMCDCVCQCEWTHYSGGSGAGVPVSTVSHGEETCEAPLANWGACGKFDSSGCCTNACMYIHPYYSVTSHECTPQ